MGFDAVRVRVTVISIVLLLIGSLVVPIMGTSDKAEAAPNPIPIVSLSLSPSQKRATVDHTQGATVSFDGMCTVEQMEFISSTVTLTASVNEGWSISISPDSVIFSNSGSADFVVSVIVPPGAEGGKDVGVIVTASCKVPVLQPSKATASSVINVVNTSPTPEWNVRIIEPRDGAIFTTDDITISGSASFNMGNVTSIEVKVCTGTWQVATGTTQWTIDYDCSLQDDGEHTISVRARSGEEDVSPITEITVTQDRPDPATVPSGGGPGSGDPTGSKTSYTTYLIIGVIIIAVILAGFWVYNRRQKDTRDYLNAHY